MSMGELRECADSVMSLFSQTDSQLNKHLEATGEFP